MISIIVISIILEELRIKKLVLIADASAKALTPPHLLAVSEHSDVLQVFLYMYKYMFAKQERHEMDDFYRKNN